MVGRCGFEHFGPIEEIHEELVRRGKGGKGFLELMQEFIWDQAENCI